MTNNDSLYAYILSVKSTEAATWTSSVIKMFFKILQNSREDTCAGVSHLESCLLKGCNFIIKETPAQMFSCKFWKDLETSFSRSSTNGSF